jgi:hypothetical protein
MDMSGESKTLLRVQSIKAKAQWAGADRMLAAQAVYPHTASLR